jgi:hypothetical protein
MFNWKQYLLNYPDLTQAGIINEKDAISHYSIFGKSENRSSCKYDIPITIITPCIRVINLQFLKESIQFDRVCEWIIIYDYPIEKKLFDDPKISEYFHTNPKSIVGNDQRNYALKRVKNENSYIYFLDDDNLMHPGIFEINLLPNKIYTFDQENGLYGKRIKVNYIDTGMFLVYYNNIQWKIDIYNADGFYIQDCYKLNKNWIYINKPICYYNKLVPLKLYSYSEIDNKSKMIFKSSWHTLENMPIEMRSALIKTININPKSKVYYFDDLDCINFMKDYSTRCYAAYHKLIPGAFKSDLFRYCLLEKYGNYYSDIGHIPYISFDQVCDDSDLVLVKEIKNLGIHNGFMYSRLPGHPFLKAAIEKCLYNIENEIYGSIDISITGPWMLKDLPLEYPKVKMLKHIIQNNEKYIYYNSDLFIKTKFNNYQSIMYPDNNTSTRSCYNTLWSLKKVFT